MTGKVTTSAYRHGIDPSGSPSYYYKELKRRCADEDSHRAGYPDRPLDDSLSLAALSYRPNMYQDQYKPLIEEALNRKIFLKDIRLTI